jgi:hypothetical protein
LAFTFAIEAKLAWYVPVNGLGDTMSAAKALPADTPDILYYGAPAPDPVPLQIPVAMLAVFTAVFVTGAFVLPRREIVNRHLQVSAAAYFSPGIFFRPPPAG